MATNGTKQRQASAAAPPRTLNVHNFAESRASELETLHSIVSNRLDNDFRSRRNKRRRTTGYDNRATKRRRSKKQRVEEVGKDDTSKQNNKKVPRHVRRRTELRKNPESGFCTSGDGTKRLRTHLWHAKRFKMTKLWGFHLPLGLQGRGQGSRAILKCLYNGGLVHDASYCSAVQLEGPEDLLLSVLRMVMLPSLTSQSEDVSCKLLSGLIYESTMLHHVGAPFSRSIAPVIYMWRPLPQQYTSVDEEGHKAVGCCGPHGAGSRSSFRQVWVWIHAAAFREGFDALTSVCQWMIDKTGLSVTCIPLEGQLAKLEVMGSRAVQLLRKILHPVTRSDYSWQLNKRSVIGADSKNQLKNSSVLENEDTIPPSGIVSLTVHDPRDFAEKGDLVVPELTSTGLLEQVHEDEGKKHTSLDGIPKRNVGLPSSLCLNPEVSIDLSDCVTLWDASKGICPPVEERVLCMKKHHQRMNSFCVGDGSSEAINSPIKEQCSISCPLLLLKDHNKNCSIVRWSVILPLSWVKAFWVPLVCSGAHAVGLREKHWIACAVGLPYFPSDFPDCSAYSHLRESEAAVSDQKAKLCPPSVRPLEVPIPPPWDCVQLAFEKQFTETGDAQTLPEKPDEKNIAYVDSMSQSNCKNCEMVAPTNHGVSFGGLVARKSNILTDFLNNTNCDHLRLLKIGDKRRHISESIKDGGMPRPNGDISIVSYGKKLCFVRVLLHAYKEGAFEEGAVVCAPHFADVKLWASRSEDVDEKLQIPQSSLGSYFIKSSSGKWELQIPCCPAAIESHRWPIGFVTTGFVRGSKKPVAGGLCDAVLLARLRQEQWDAVPMKQRRKEIYVLVRNMRSTAYRLALATIILEQQEEDLDYM